jgi:hypothetical protein
MMFRGSCALQVAESIQLSVLLFEQPLRFQTLPLRF